VKYWGIGNESWGCGGSMRPEYYADEYRRYNTFVKNFSGNNCFRIACGANSANYNWTDVLMKQAARNMNGLALHYYTAPRWELKQRFSATTFTEPEWAKTMVLALRMDDLIQKHSAIMDSHDPEKKVAMVIDEWGTWWEVEEGTNPGFLYQQNTQRDALVAGVSLNIFNNHADRVRMTNIAQTINVLQAMILTEGAKMILTPSYHVFEMYKEHQDGELLECKVVCEKYTCGEDKVPGITASASKAASGAITVTLTNCNPTKNAEVTLDIVGGSVGKVAARVLTTKKMNAMNTFEKPNAVKPEAFKDFTKKKDSLVVKLPAKSVTLLTIG
jgi:alpha-N-arabinofuranosidase